MNATSLQVTRGMGLNADLSIFQFTTGLGLNADLSAAAGFGLHESVSYF